MRNFINIIDNLLLEKSRGLLYRDKGDNFFQGSKDNPTAEIDFVEARYFPSQPGAYTDYDEMASAVQDVHAQFPNIVWVNRATRAMKAFAVLIFDGPTPGQKSYFGKFFNEIKPDMAGLWKNNELPGGWQLNKAVSLKGAYYRLKPADLFDPDSTFATPEQCVSALAANPKQNPAVPKIMPGMQELLTGKFPLFTDVGDMATAVRDDLGETIGPIALVQDMIRGGGAEAARKDILGDRGSYAGSEINFPAAKNNGLVDSYLLHPSGVEIGISSKGEKGASASVKNISDGVTRARAKRMTKLLDQYEEQIKVIDEVGTLSSVDFPIVFGERLGMISNETGQEIKNMIKNNGQSRNPEILDLMSDINAKTDNPRYNRGYHALAALARRVSREINKDPKFGEACLKFLNVSPIIQLHLNGSDRGGNYQVTGFTSKYPPDFRGTVGLDATKVYAATGIIGRVSFSYNGGGTQDTDTAAGTSDLPSNTELDQIADPSLAAGTRLIGPAAGKKIKPRTDPETLGRSRRRENS